MSLNKSNIKNILSKLENCLFYVFIEDHVSKDLSWEINGTSILSAKYTNKNLFLNNIIAKISSKISSDWTMTINNYYATSNTLIVEMTGNAKTITNSNYNNEYCWIMHFDSNLKIIHLTAYYDSLFVNKTLGE